MAIQRKPLGLGQQTMQYIMKSGTIQDEIANRKGMANNNTAET